MANSNWVEADKRCQQFAVSDLFAHYCGWIAGVGPPLYGEYWFVSRIADRRSATGGWEVTLVFFCPWDQSTAYKSVVNSFEELATVLKQNSCPIPQSLSTILHEYRQGRDGKAAVNFYTQSGDVF